MFEDLKAELTKVESTVGALLGAGATQTGALRTQLEALSKTLMRPLDEVVKAAAKVRADITKQATALKTEIKKLAPPA